MSVIYLEGPDGAGKTTLAQALLRQAASDGQETAYLHDSYSPRQWRHSTIRLGLALRYSQRRRLVVLDRGWLGDNIYGSVFRPGQQGAWVRWHHGLMLRHHILTVLCVPLDRDRYLNDFKKLAAGGRERYVDQMDRVYDRYAALAGLGTAPPDTAEDYTGLISRRRALGPYVHVYDRYRDGARVNSVAEHLVNKARHLNKDFLCTDPTPTLPNISGSFATAKTVLVGEQSADPDGPMPYPFFADRNASRFLALALQRAGIPQPDLLMVNAYEPRTQDTWCLARVARRGLPCVALGRHAERALKALGQPAHAVLPHPQHVARFQKYDVGYYATLLQEALA